MAGTHNLDLVCRRNRSFRSRCDSVPALSLLPPASFPLWVHGKKVYARPLSPVSTLRRTKHLLIRNHLVLQRHGDGDGVLGAAGVSSFTRRGPGAVGSD